MQQQLFTELFRPKTLEQTILVPRVMNELKKGLVDNILLYGSPGIGKTCCTRILAKTGTDPLFINASLDNGIGIIRDKVISYGTHTTLFGGEEQMKVIVLEECDNLTNDAWDSLRATIEQFHSHVRFIANCNYIEKIPDPIKSRFNCVCLDPINNEEETYLKNAYIVRLKQILNAIHISYTDEILLQFVNSSFPDFRTLTKKVQQMYTKGETTMTAEALGAVFDCADLFNIILTPSNTWDNYKKMVGEWSTRASEAILQIGKQFPDYIMNVCPDKVAKIPMIMIAIGEASVQVNISIDKFITLLALVYKLQQICNS